MLEYWKTDKIGWEGSKMQNVEIRQYIFSLMSPVDKENSSWERKV